jgi:hypothetical protein
VEHTQTHRQTHTHTKGWKGTFWYEGRTILSVDNERAPQDNRLVPAAAAECEKDGGVDMGVGALHLLGKGSAERCSDITDEGGRGQRHDSNIGLIDAAGTDGELKICKRRESVLRRGRRGECGKRLHSANAEFEKCKGCVLGGRVN